MSLSETSSQIDHVHEPLYLVKHGHSEKPGKGLDLSPREKWGWMPSQYNYRWIFNENDYHDLYINRMAFCMRMRCWSGGNDQGVCPRFILALLISVFFAIFHMEAPENTQEFFSIAFL